MLINIVLCQDSCSNVCICISFCFCSFDSLISWNHGTWQELLHREVKHWTVGLKLTLSSTAMMAKHGTLSLTQLHTQKRWVNAAPSIFWLKYRVSLDFDCSLDMLEQYAVPQVHHCANLFGIDAIYQLDGTPSHFCRAVRTCLYTTFPDAWIVHVGPNAWLSMSLIWLQQVTARTMCVGLPYHKPFDEMQTKVIAFQLSPCFHWHATCVGGTVVHTRHCLCYVETTHGTSGNLENILGGKWLFFTNTVHFVLCL